MTVAQPTGAVSHLAVDWQTLDWEQAHRTVRRLQARIVKATQEGRWGKVKALQHLLTHSFSAKALAVKRVTENQGKRTPGVDGELWDTPHKKAKAVQSLRQHGYRPQPLRRCYIDKEDGRKRPLGIPTMLDRAMQALYLQALDPVAETTADPNSYGFRPERSTADAIEQCFKVLAQHTNATWILEGDIRGCFDHISHDWLETHIPMDKGMLRKWLKAGYLEDAVLHPTDEGTPQGGIISPVLANLTLDGVEAVLQAARRSRSTSAAMPMTGLSLGTRKTFWNMRSNPWSSSSSRNAVWNFRPRKRASLISKTALTSWGSMSGSTTASCLSSPPRKV
jgi:RNA-directed DNA polymerase